MYSEAMSLPNRSKWNEAAKEEYNSLLSDEVPGKEISLWIPQDTGYKIGKLDPHLTLLDVTKFSIFRALQLCSFSLFIPALSWIVLYYLHGSAGAGFALLQLQLMPLGWLNGCEPFIWAAVWQGLPPSATSSRATASAWVNSSIASLRIELPFFGWAAAFS